MIGFPWLSVAAGLLERCGFPMPSQAIAREVAKCTEHTQSFVFTQKRSLAALVPDLLVVLKRGSDMTVAGVSELEIQGSMLGGAGLDMAAFTELVLATAEKSGALPSDQRPDPRSDDPGAILPEEEIGADMWHGPLPMDPQAPPTLGGGCEFRNFVGHFPSIVVGGILTRRTVGHDAERGWEALTGACLAVYWARLR
jgi:hypothetical protein